MERAPLPLTAEELYEQARQATPISLSTVYRILGVCSEHGLLLRSVRCRNAPVSDPAAEADADPVGGRLGDAGLLASQKKIGGCPMKIVVVKSPKLFGGILRCLFGIKKVSNIDG